ncbi:unnamed protein product [Anisakis simplex]|uniref:Ribonuclease H-like domain-containing protein n=1 Tax=Anisakis simplex TaxID=6269 RepID=A0A0M3JXW3_ANISI|nr:unnamed protein product [Anisakis simplex]
MNENWMVARNGTNGATVTAVDDDFYGDDEDLAITPPPAPVDNIPEEEAEHERRMLNMSASNSIALSQLQNEIRKMRDEKTEQIGHIEYLKFKKSYEQKLNDERRRHEHVEEDLRSELTCQEQEMSSRQFRERFNTSAMTTPSDDPHQHHQQQSQEAVNSNNNNVSVEQSSPAMLPTKKVIWNARRSGAKFPRTLNDMHNVASLFSHRKRPYGETQATFQTVPSPMKDPYQRPDYFYDIKRKRPTAAVAETPLNWESDDDWRNCVDGERRESVTKQAMDTGTQTSTENHYDVSVCVNDKNLMDVTYALQDSLMDEQFWYLDVIRTIRYASGCNGNSHIPLRERFSPH